MTESRATEAPAPTEKGSMPADFMTGEKAEVPSSSSVPPSAGTTSADVNTWKTEGYKQTHDFMESEDHNSRPWLNEIPKKDKDSGPLMHSPSMSPGRYDDIFKPMSTNEPREILNSHVPSSSAGTVEKPAQQSSPDRPPKIGPRELDSGSEDYP